MVDFGDKLFVIGGNNKTNGARRLLFVCFIYIIIVWWILVINCSLLVEIIKLMALEGYCLFVLFISLLYGGFW